MTAIVLRPNATPVYDFLSYILATLEEGEDIAGKKVLDCGAGGPLPPLVAFRQQGCEAWGIDVSDEQLRKAEQFCEGQGIDLNLRLGDMREIPFEDEAFDFVYEQYSLCHLTKTDTVRAVAEMQRVLKSGGLCLLGLISLDSWTTMLGPEGEPGEFWMEEGGERVVHSAYSDEEAERLLNAWEVLQKQKRSLWRRASMAKMSPEEWMDAFGRERDASFREALAAMYERRESEVQYTHVYFILRKPEPST